VAAEFVLWLLSSLGGHQHHWHHQQQRSGFGVNVVSKSCVVVIITKLSALSAVSSADKQVWGKGVGKIYFVVIVVVAIIINGKLSALSFVDCIVKCSWVGAVVGIDDGWE